MIAARQIAELAEKIVREFHPERIILFGSYAYGTPTEHSDVDLLVVMPFEGKAVYKAVEIRGKVDPPFSMDLLVRTPEELEWRLANDDFFLLDIVEKGKVLYDAAGAGVGGQLRPTLPRRPASCAPAKRQTTMRPASTLSSVPRST